MRTMFIALLGISFYLPVRAESTIDEDAVQTAEFNSEMQWQAFNSDEAKLEDVRYRGAVRGSGRCRSLSGVASTYGSGQRTANGEHFNPGALTAAHKTLPFGTRVLVRNPRNGRSVIVRINDRGPFIAGRAIDLSTAAARAIGMDGLASVSMQACF